LTNPPFSTQSLQTAAKEYVGATEIELNELLKRFVVRQAKRRAVSGPRAEPARLQQPVMAVHREVNVEIGRNAGLPFLNF
jgi:translation initiation factor 2 beta subunit (eIF-2beta)/eIF-5